MNFTDYIFIPSACIAMYGMYNIFKIKKRLNEIEVILPLIERRFTKIETEFKF